MSQQKPFTYPSGASAVEGRLEASDKVLVALKLAASPESRTPVFRYASEVVLANLELLKRTKRAVDSDLAQLVLDSVALVYICISECERSVDSTGHIQISGEWQHQAVLITVALVHATRSIKRILERSALASISLLTSDAANIRQKRDALNYWISATRFLPGTPMSKALEQTIHSKASAALEPTPRVPPNLELEHITPKDQNLLMSSPASVPSTIPDCIPAQEGTINNSEPSNCGDEGSSEGDSEEGDLAAPKTVGQDTSGATRSSNKPSSSPSKSQKRAQTPKTGTLPPLDDERLAWLERKRLGIIETAVPSATNKAKASQPKTGKASDTSSLSDGDTSTDGEPRTLDLPRLRKEKKEIPKRAKEEQRPGPPESSDDTDISPASQVAIKERRHQPGGSPPQRPANQSGHTRFATPPAPDAQNKRGRPPQSTSSGMVGLPLLTVGPNSSVVWHNSGHNSGNRVTNYTNNYVTN